MVLEKTLERPLDNMETKPVNLKGTRSWTLIGKIDVKLKLPSIWSFDVNSRLIGKVLMLGKNEGRKRKRASEDEMAGQHHWWNEHELGQTPEMVARGQGGLTCCSLWGHKVRHDWVTDSNVHYVHMYLYLLCMYLVFNTYIFYLANIFLYLEYTPINTYKANKSIFCASE